jgi:hypothetical protein
MKRSRATIRVTPPRAAVVPYVIAPVSRANVRNEPKCPEMCRNVPLCAARSKCAERTHRAPKCTVLPSTHPLQAPVQNKPIFGGNCCNEGIHSGLRVGTLRLPSRLRQNAGPTWSRACGTRSRPVSLPFLIRVRRPLIMSFTPLVLVLALFICLAATPSRAQDGWTPIGARTASACCCTSARSTTSRPCG